MFCTQCGEERQSEDIYCGHCGHRVGNEPQQRPQERYIDLQVVGVRYSNTDGNQRQKIIQHLKEGQNIQLHREPHNPHDSNAIRVETLDGQQFGYIAREIALLYANSLDHRSLSTWPGQVKKIAGEVYGNDPVRGVIITIKVPPGSDATDAPSLTTRVPSRSAVPAPGSTINHDARTWHDVWNAHYRDGNYRKAVEAGKKAVELDTENAGLWNNLGASHVKLGSHEQAIEAYEKAVELDPENAIAWYNLGWSLGNLGRHEQALEACEKAVELDPENADAWNNLGWSLGNLGRHEEAIEARQKAVELDPEDAIAWRGLAYNLGHLGRHEQAIEACEKAVELDPEDAIAWYNLGWSLGNLGRHEQALEADEKAVELDPEYAYAWGNLGWSLGNLGRHEQALEARQKAVELDPEDADAWGNLGWSLGNLGRHEEALEARQKAEEITRRTGPDKAVPRKIKSTKTVPDSPRIRIKLDRSAPNRPR